MSKHGDVWMYNILGVLSQSMPLVSKMIENVYFIAQPSCDYGKEALCLRYHRHQW
jgi:hypothetical protein